MNVSRNYQRVESKTTSYHFSLGHAAQNRENSTNLFEGAPSGTLTLDDAQVLPSINDLERCLSDFEELAYKYVSPQLLDCCIIWHTYGACEVSIQIPYA